MRFKEGDIQLILGGGLDPFIQDKSIINALILTYKINSRVKTFEHLVQVVIWLGQKVLLEVVVWAR